MYIIVIICLSFSGFFRPSVQQINSYVDLCKVGGNILKMQQAAAQKTGNSDTHNPSTSNNTSAAAMQEGDTSVTMDVDSEEDVKSDAGDGGGGSGSVEDNESVISEGSRESEEQQQRSFDSYNNEEMNDSTISTEGEPTAAGAAAGGVPEKRGIMLHITIVALT